MTRPLSARYRFVGDMLRRYRNAIGFSLDSAALTFGVDRSRLSRIEEGRCTINRNELLWVLDEYGASMEARDTLATVISDLSVWWRKYTSALPQAYVDLAAFLTVAEKVTVYDSQQIPLLLQTGAYSQILASANRALDDHASVVLPGMTEDLRREVLESGDAALQFVVGEAALRNHVGDDIMRDQLAQLDADATMSELRILPIGSTPNPVFWATSMTLLEFPAEVESVVHLGGPRGGVFLLDEDDVVPCAQLLSDLQHASIPASSGMELIGDMISALARPGSSLPTGGQDTPPRRSRNRDACCSPP